MQAPTRPPTVGSTAPAPRLPQKVHAPKRPPWSSYEREQLQAWVRVNGAPREGECGLKNLKELQKKFGFCGHIEGSENRGINLDQLGLVHDHIQSSCRDWGASLASLTFFDVQKWLIHPATKQTQSALVEHLTSKRQLPSWFVSHRWGDPLSHFLQCLEAHASARSMVSGSIIYWICAYACRQEELLEAQGLDNLRQSAFARALQAAKFRVLLLLHSDEEAPATGPVSSLARAWCIFECSLCLDQPGALLDIGTWHHSRALLVTDGLPKRDKVIERYGGGAGLQAKAQRERGFPRRLVEAALSVDVRAAGATLPEDRGRLLNSIAGRTLSLEPMAEHMQYGMFNKRLRSYFAAALLRPMLAAERPGDEAARKAHGKLLASLAGAVAADGLRRSLHLNLAGCPLGDPELVALVADSLPPRVTTLSMNLMRTGVTDAGLHAITAAVPHFLNDLTLNLSACLEVTEQGLLFLFQNLPQRLRTLSLFIVGTGVSDASMPRQLLMMRGGKKSFNLVLNGKPVSDLPLLQSRMGRRERGHVQGSAYAD